MSSLGPNEEEFARSIDRIAANDPTFTDVVFDEMGIGDDGAGRLVAALEGNTVVTHLWLANNSISAELVRALVGVLENSTTLTALDLSGSSFGDEGARAVARLLRNNSSLVRLFLSHCGIGAEGARVLAEALTSNSTLSRLFLRGNNISDEGASALARGLPGNSTLTHLYLNGNRISDVAARDLAEALLNNSFLRVLFLGGNTISDVGVRLLGKALLVNSSVITINLEENDISYGLERPMDDLGGINVHASSPQEALEFKIEWLRNFNEGGLSLLGIEESEVEEEVRRIEVVCQVGWLISSGVDGEKEEAVTLVLDGLESFQQADQRKRLFERLLGVPGRGVEVAASVDAMRGRALYRYATECGAAPVVLMNVIRAHGSLCTCRDVKHKLYPFMLLATMSEAGVGDVMEVLKMDPTIVRSGICQNVAKNKRKRGSSTGKVGI